MKVWCLLEKLNFLVTQEKCRIVSFHKDVFGYIMEQLELVSVKASD